MEKLLKNPRFNGSDYDPKYDNVRLSGQILDIFNLMSDKKWRTLEEISLITGHGESSVSAQLRNMRKERFGANAVGKRVRGDRKNGLFEYQLITMI